MRLWYSMWDSNPHLTELKSVASSSWANRAYWRYDRDSNSESAHHTHWFSRPGPAPYWGQPYHVASSKPFLAWLWWIWQGSNLLRLALQANALPVELQIQMVGASGLEPVSVDYKSTALTN